MFNVKIKSFVDFSKIFAWTWLDLRLKCLPLVVIYRLDFIASVMPYFICKFIYCVAIVQALFYHRGQILSPARRICNENFCLFGFFCESYQASEILFGIGKCRYEIFPCVALDFFLLLLGGKPAIFLSAYLLSKYALSANPA